MKLYIQNTKITIKLQGDGLEMFDYSLPTPDAYHRYGDTYTLEYLLNGFFHTIKGIDNLNDILARFTLSMPVRSIETSLVPKNMYGGYRLEYFKGLKSISRAKNYEKIDNGQDNLFWSIKLYTEALIRESGEGNLVAYSLIESFAFDRFIDRAKDKSTLKAKCRSIWNWYDARDWTIPTRKGLGMSRSEGAKIAHTKLAKDTEAKVKKAIGGLQFMQEKINIANVARDAGVDRNTAKKYLIELGFLE